MVFEFTDTAGGGTKIDFIAGVLVDSGTTQSLEILLRAENPSGRWNNPNGKGEQITILLPLELNIAMNVPSLLMTKFRMQGGIQIGDLKAEVALQYADPSQGGNIGICVALEEFSLGGLIEAATGLPLGIFGDLISPYEVESLVYKDALTSADGINFNRPDSPCDELQPFSLLFNATNMKHIILPFKLAHACISLNSEAVQLQAIVDPFKAAGILEITKSTNPLCANPKMHPDNQAVLDPLRPHQSCPFNHPYQPNQIRSAL
jgi:hypothetical protein